MAKSNSNNVRDIGSELAGAEATVAKAAEKVAELRAELAKTTAHKTLDGTRAVVVCTGKGGVFFGYAADVSGETISLKNARNAYYWKCSGGILELGFSGPQSGSKIGERADVTLRNVTAVIECTTASVTAWEAAKWG